VNAAALIDLRSGRAGRLAAKLRNEDGIGLVELLIALLVLNVGIFATLGAFTSAATTLRRASHISTAAAIADKTVEGLRDSSYQSIGNLGPTDTTGADGLPYNVQVALLSTASQLNTGSYKGSTQVKVVQVTVRDGAVGGGGPVLVTNTSTFSRCTQAGLGSVPDPASSACQN
jgi:Tfp pilus assembly protein PilV